MFPKQFNKKKTHLKGCTINASNPKIKETTPLSPWSLLFENGLGYNPPKQSLYYMPRRSRVLEGVRVMVLNATFNNISVISWWSVLLMEETEIPLTCRKSLTNFIT